jgi:hypothetical protein
VKEASRGELRDAENAVVDLYLAVAGNRRRKLAIFDGFRDPVSQLKRAQLWPRMI